MKIDPKLVERWRRAWQTDIPRAEYIAQRAADYALEQAALVCEEDPVYARAIRALKDSK